MTRHLASPSRAARSRGFLRRPFGDATSGEMTPEYDAFSTYFNIDNGTGRIHGVWLQEKPGFQFVQDRLEYNSRTHHSNMDVYDRVQGEDVVQMAAVVAVFAYVAATADEKMPRKLWEPGESR